jgi:hypothetical protein
VSGAGEDALRTHPPITTPARTVHPINFICPSYPGANLVGGCILFDERDPRAAWKSSTGR